MASIVDLGDTLSVSIEQFCTRVNNGAHDWYEKAAADPIVMENVATG
jgi:hypothetical protein